MKKLIPILLSALMLTGCAGAGNQPNSYRQISMDEAVAMMEQESGYIILDVRTPEEFAEKHIPNAINIPNENIGTDEISALPDKDQLIMVYCRSGRRSKEAAGKLVKLGYTNIVEFGGIIDWKGETVSGELRSRCNICTAGSKDKAQSLPLLNRSDKNMTEPLITHTSPLSQIDEAYDLFENKRDGVIKVAVEC